MDNNNICKEHSGCTKSIKHLEESDERQWHAIDGMKNWIIATLTSSVFSLIGIIVTLIVILEKR